MIFTTSNVAAFDIVEPRIPSLVDNDHCVGTRSQYLGNET